MLKNVIILTFEQMESLCVDEFIMYNDRINGGIRTYLNMRWAGTTFLKDFLRPEIADYIETIYENYPKEQGFRLTFPDRETMLMFKMLYL